MGFVRQWEVLFEKAKADFKAARILMDNVKDEDDQSIILFHLQQAVEKSLKAILSHNNIEFPRTHDIELIYNLIIKSGIILPDFSEQLIDLSDFAVDTRYSYMPDEVEDIESYFCAVNELLELTDKYLPNE